VTLSAFTRSMAVVPALATPAIPYRTDAAMSTGSMVTAFVTTGVLLVLLIAVLLYSRRRGWLPSPARPSDTSNGKDIRVIVSRRISAATTVHVIEYDGQSYLLTESSRATSAATTPLPRATGNEVDV